ncbi:hypothetical protein TUM18999_29200 [Pseudomonas tohonis]|uniref:Uncharacterized protein n=1 Tax=Pseudomonas tohonis TaxID=2725477 RepID=A0A6J4E603_9PSED|nr:hypothetical protein TUM18999_29200 [Pseudomonas tohonis]GJN54032.1 hypothetical protein TUM20286_37840 [Pseudomonas tohonis]
MQALGERHGKDGGEQEDHGDLQRAAFMGHGSFLGLTYERSDGAAEGARIGGGGRRCHGAALCPVGAVPARGAKILAAARRAAILLRSRTRSPLP